MKISPFLICLVLICFNSFAITGEFPAVTLPNGICKLYSKSKENLLFPCSATKKGDLIFTAAHCGSIGSTFFAECNNGRLVTELSPIFEKEDILILKSNSKNIKLNDESEVKIPIDNLEAARILRENKCYLIGFGGDDKSGMSEAPAGFEVDYSDIKRNKRNSGRIGRTDYLISNQLKFENYSTQILHSNNDLQSGLTIFGMKYVTKKLIKISRNHIQAHFGDSGGPLVCKYNEDWYLLGIISGGTYDWNHIQSIESLYGKF